MSLSFQNRAPFRLTLIIAAVLFAASLSLTAIYANEGSDGFLHNVQNGFRSVFNPLGAVAESAGSAIDSAEEGVSDSLADDATLSALREQNATLKEALAQAEEYRLENERLQALLGIMDKYDIDGIAARVIGRSDDAWNRTVTLDAGRSSGIEPGLTVIGAGGVIGQVISATEGSCVVRLIDDPQSGVAAIVQASRAEGMVRGSLSGLLYLEGLDAEAEVAVGDIVLTSGLGGSYTKGLLIGTVVRIEEGPGDDSRRIVVAQNAKASNLEEAVVVFSAEGSSASGEDASDDDDYGEGR